MYSLILLVLVLVKYIVLSKHLCKNKNKRNYWLKLLILTTEITTC